MAELPTTSECEEEEEGKLAMKKLKVHVTKVVMGVIPCLFLGKPAKVLSLMFKGVGDPGGNLYPLGEFEAENLS